jgi:hypothetical protein
VGTAPQEGQHALRGGIGRDGVRRGAQRSNFASASPGGGGSNRRGQRRSPRFLRFLHVCSARAGAGWMHGAPGHDAQRSSSQASPRRQPAALRQRCSSFCLGFRPKDGRVVAGMLGSDFFLVAELVITVFVQAIFSFPRKISCYADLLSQPIWICRASAFASFSLSCLCGWARQSWRDIQTCHSLLVLILPCRFVWVLY